ncbi:MAG: hypothetical protein K2G14_02365 [Ruminococcus sp.]|nr:hypothetical protein [Ruminococcus sp.]
MNTKPTLKELQGIMLKSNNSLDLRGTQITALPDGLTVGGSLDLRGTQITGDKNYHYLRTGDYIEGKYLYADGILTHVKKTRKIEHYTLYIGKVKGKNVVSDGVYYAHCDKVRDGITDLKFKAAKDRGAGQYKNLSLDSIVKKDDAITMYRVITGACRQGTQDFLDSLTEIKKEYTVREIISLTKGSYGSDSFKRFFEKE